MAVTQLVMIGVPAFVGLTSGPTTVKFFIDENQFTAANSIGVDLSKTPDVIPPAQWATTVDVDMQTTGGFTTIGPTFHNGNHIGAAYIAQRIANQYQAVLAAWPPAPDALYQYTAVLRDDGSGGQTRYHGFKVQVVSAARGTLIQLALIRTGQAAPQPGGPVRWIDLSDPSTVDPASNGFTTITPTSAVGTVGALFVTQAGMQAQALDRPKHPPSQGW